MFIASLLVLLWRAVSALDTKWTANLPTGMSLISGDWISISLDDYVNVKGAEFTATTSSGTLPTDAIQNKVSFGTSSIKLKPSISTTVPTAVAPSTGCTNMIRVNATHVVLLCQSRFLFRVPLNDKLELLNNFFNARVEISTDVNLLCTDIAMIPSTTWMITTCYSSPATPASTNLILYVTNTVEYWPMGFTGEPSVNSTYHISSTINQISIPNKNSFPRFDVYGWSGSPSTFVMGIWNAAPFTGTTTVADTSTFWKCSGTVASNAFTTNCGSYSVSTIYTITSNFPGSVRGIRFLDNDVSGDYGFLVIVADGATAAKKIGVGVVALAAAPSFEPKNKATGTIFNTLYYADITSWAPMSDPNAMLGFVFATSPLKSANINHVMVVDRLNLVYLGLSVATVSGFNQLVEPNPKSTWSTPFECRQTASSGVFAARVQTFGTTMSNLDSRVLVDYRVGTNLASFSGVGFSFNYTKYGCWPTERNTHSGIAFKNFNQFVSFDSESMFYGSLSADTLLKIKVTNPNAGLATTTITVNARTSGIASPAATSTLTYTVASKSEDFNLLNLTSTTMRAYPNTKFWLPLASSSFVCNAPRASVDSVASSSVTVGHSQMSKPIKNVVNTANQGSTQNFKRVISLDRDWSLAIFSSTGSTGEGFALIKTQYEAGVAYFSDQVFEAEIQYSNNKVRSIAKAFKLADSFCIIGLGIVDSQNSLFVGCYRLSSKARNTPYESSLPSGIDYYSLITDRSEVVSVQPLVNGNRVDILATYIDSTAGLTKLAHFSITVTSTTAGGITTNSFANPTARKQVTIVNMDENLLLNYSPLDILPEFWGDEESTNLVSIRMYKAMSPPMVVRFNFFLTGDTPNLVRVRAMRIDNSDLIFCPMRDDLVFYSPKTRQIFAQRWDKINVVSKGQSRFYFPITDYGIQSIIQFDCITEKGYFQILAKATIGTTKKFIVVTYRGGESNVGGRRVHSISEVTTDSTYISSSSDKDFIYTWVTSSVTPAADKYIIQNSLRGPTFYVDTTDKVDKFNVTLNQTSRKNGDNGNMASFIILLTQPMLTPSVKQREAFDLNVNSEISLDDKCDIAGPVIDIQKVGDDAGPPNGPLISLTPRITGRGAYKIGTVTKAPTKVMVEGVFQILVYGMDRIVQIQGDPIMTRSGANNQVMTLISEISNAHDALLVNTTIDGVAVAVVKTSVLSNFQYSLYQLGFNSGANPQYTSVTSQNLFADSTNYETMQGTWIKDYGLVLALSSNINFVSNYIKLIGFKYDTSSKLFTKEKEAIVLLSPSRELGTFTLVSYYDGSDSNNIVRRATILGRYLNFPGFTVAHWNLVSPTINMVSSAAATRVSDNTADNVLVNFNYLRCWNRPDKDKTCSCMVDVLGISKYYVDITFKVPPADDSEPIDSIVKAFEFYVPPKYSLVKADRAANFFGLLLERTEPFATAVSQIIKYDDCQRLIAVYKPTANQISYVYSTVLCSSFGTYMETGMDFAMESFSGTSAGEYVFYSNTLDPNKLIKYDFISSAKVRVNMAIPDPSKIFLKFIGLTGPYDVNAPTVKLGDLAQGNAPPASSSTWWIWLLVILLIVVVAIGGYFAWVWFKNKSSSPSASMSSSSSYRKPEEFRPANDSEDLRL